MQRCLSHTMVRNPADWYTCRTWSKTKTRALDVECQVSASNVNHPVPGIRATDLIYHICRADTGYCTEETLILFLKSEIIFLCIIIHFFLERSQMMLSLIGNLSKEHQDSIRNVIPKWDSQDSSCSSFKWEETRKMNKQWIIY